jgi:hypothetical protein
MMKEDDRYNEKLNPEKLGNPKVTKTMTPKWDNREERNTKEVVVVIAKKKSIQVKKSEREYNKEHSHNKQELQTIR